MTDPVDTGALRDMGDALTNDGHLFGPRITAAADEVDRLRDELKISENRVGGYEEVVTRLRSVINDAPHDILKCDSCLPTRTAILPCTCWKAEAL